MREAIYRLTCFALLASLSLLPACLERKETLTVQPTGALHVDIEYRTDRVEEITEGDAMPALAGGWLVERTETVKDDGSVEVRLAGTTAFPPKFNLPANYALPRDDHAGAYLQFPTTVKVQKRPDGTYYHFHRTYRARAWGQIDYLRKTILEDRIHNVEGMDIGEWTPEQRVMIVQALAEFETAKMLTFARAALLQVKPDAPQDAWLLAEQAAEESLKSLDYETLSQLLQATQMTDEERKAANISEDEDFEKTIKAESERLQQMVLDILRNSLKASGLDGADLAAFDAAYNFHKLKHLVSEDLEDEKFEITVKMPGEIVASNAESQSAGAAMWSFDGGMLHDREIELMVTSRVPR